MSASMSNVCVNDSAFISGLQWQCVDTGRLSLLDPLSLMYTVGQFLLSIQLLVYLMCRQFRWQLGRICAWRRALGIFVHFISAACIAALRLQVPWIEDETRHMCPESWRPMPELCFSTRELMWLHPDAYRFAWWDQSVLYVTGSWRAWSLSIWSHYYYYYYYFFYFIFFRPLAQGQRLVNSKLVDWLKWRF